MDTKHLVVVKSNKVVEAGYRLSLYEQRILLSCIAQINSKGSLTIEDRFEVSAKEIVELSGVISLDRVYSILKEAVDKLSLRKVIICDPDPNNPKEKTRSISWISSVGYMPNEGKVLLRFGFDMIPYLTILTKEFTQYKLENVTKFKSTYSIRLYELLMQWISTGKREVEIAWLKKQLQVEESYPQMCDFKKRVIDVAIKEINDHSDIHVNKPDQRKAGRVITHFIFTFGFKPPKASKTPSKNTARTKPLIPLFEGHPNYVVDTSVVLADHEVLKVKPISKSKVIDDVTKQKIAGLKKATKAK
jgi:plasmid replication initiation protein